MSGGTVMPVGQPCLFLLFAPGKRPDSAQLYKALRATSLGHVSHDPGEKPDGERAISDWLEVVVDGLTFDILGLSPAQALARPAARHGLGLTAEQGAGLGAIGLAPGPHLAGGAHTMPVVRTLLRLGTGLARHLDGFVGVQWLPSSGLVDGDLFIEMVGAWLTGAAFPALGLIGMSDLPDGGVASDGLAFFVRRELVLDRSLCSDRLATARLLSRLADRLITSGELTSPVDLSLPDGGALKLMPEGAIIRVSPG